MYGLKNNPVTIAGKSRLEVKRRALDYWYRHSRATGLTLKEFLQRCRLSADEKTIFFHPEGVC